MLTKEVVVHPEATSKVSANQKPESRLKNKIFSCEECEYSSDMAGNLNAHTKRVHKQIRDYSCDDCSHKFTSRQQRDRHFKLVHKGIKDFKCTKSV